MNTNYAKKKLCKISISIQNICLLIEYPVDFVKKKKQKY